MAHRAGEQGLGVVRPLLGFHASHHLLVAGKLDVPAQQQIGQPQQGVEPVHAQQYKAQGLPPVVSALDVGPLVGHYIVHGVLVQTEGKVNPGVHQSQHEGGEHRITLVEVILQPYRRGHPPPQAQIAHSAPPQQPRHTKEPEDRQYRKPNLQEVGGGVGGGGGGLGEHRVDGLVQVGKSGVDPGGGVGEDGGGDGLSAGNEAQSALQGEGEDEPHPYNAPQQHMGPLWGPFQHQAGQQHRQHQPAGGDAPVYHM